MEEIDPGLCGHCEFAQGQESRRGGVFVRCRRADRGEAYARYPTLPVRDCQGFERSPGPPGQSRRAGSTHVVGEESG